MAVNFGNVVTDPAAQARIMGLANTRVSQNEAVPGYGYVPGEGMTHDQAVDQAAYSFFPTYNGSGSGLSLAGSLPGSVGAGGVPGISGTAGGAPVAPQLASFAPPDPNGFTKDPSYQFTLNQGVNALQNSAAARGTLLTGATAKGIQDYGQQSALQGYQQAYQNALSTYGTNANTAQTNFGNQNTTFGQNLAARGQASQIGLAQNAQAQAAQAQSFNEGQTQYQNQVGAQQYNNSLAMQANQTQYDRALQTGAPYNLASYALPGLPQTRTLASSAYA